MAADGAVGAGQRAGGEVVVGDGVLMAVAAASHPGDGRAVVVGAVGASVPARSVRGHRLAVERGRPWRARLVWRKRADIGDSVWRPAR